MVEELEAIAAAPSEDDPAARLLALVRELAIELHPSREASLRVELDSSLDKDLGFDSLGRAELLLRLERAFDIRLPEELLAEAETPDDLLHALLRAEPSGRLAALTEPHAPALGPAEAAPAEAGTVTEVLDWHVGAHPDRAHILLSDGGEDESTITYRALAQDARAVAQGLLRLGLEKGDRVAIMLPTEADFFSAFFGILYAGGIPVPIYPPVRPSQLEDHLRRQTAILRNAGASILVTMPQARAVAYLLRSQVEALRTVETVDALRFPAGARALPAVAPDDTALLQYTSGSTGNPKGVVLSHANLLANIRAMGRAMEVTTADVFVSWLPLYHDMGLIGAWLGCQYFAVPVVIMSPLTFLSRPASWLWAIHRHRGTLSGAPNFAFELCVRRLEAPDLEGLDLSSLRMVVNGAEPVSPVTIRQFSERFAPYGFRAEALAPVYGLAESSVGLAFPPPGRLPVIDRVQRAALSDRGEAVPVGADDANALEVVACGRPIPGHQVRIVDATGREVGERQEGRLQFRGPSSTSGYFRDQEQSRALFDGEWLETGDLAYIAGGDVFLTGRIKDIIIRAGRNIYPQEVEAAVGEVEGVRKGCVAVFGSQDPDSGTERIVVLAETRETGAETLEALRRRVNEVTTDILETPPDDVVLAPPHTVLKTSSGKLRRAASRQLYEQGAIGARPRALWWQVVRLTLAGFAAEARSWRRAAADVLYAAYWWGVVGVIAAVAWPLVVLLPGERWRRAVFRGAARLVLKLTAMPLAVDGLEHLPPEGTVLVANHASYLDGLVLTAALPGALSFVAKKELAGQLFAGLFLPRIGTLFVERFDPGAGVEDTKTAVAAARAGRRPVFFAEGTLSRRPGLQDFHLGAFVVAVEAGVPVTPVTLRGTRSALRDDKRWFPRRVPLGVSVAPPLAPEGDDWQAALRLRDAARAEILARCGEPDLAGDSSTFDRATRQIIHTPDS